MNEEKIKVPVRGGYLVAERNPDPDYDGITVYFETLGKEPVDLVLLESKKEDDFKRTNVYCYEDVFTEEWLHRFTVDHRNVYKAISQPVKERKPKEAAKVPKEVWVITGYDSDTSIWDPDVFFDEKEAREAFKQYVDDFNATRYGNLASWEYGSIRLKKIRL